MGVFIREHESYLEIRNNHRHCSTLEITLYCNMYSYKHQNKQVDTATQIYVVWYIAGHLYAVNNETCKLHYTIHRSNKVRQQRL